MTRIRDISDTDSYVPTEEQADAALQQLIEGKHSLHIPPEFEDADIVIGCVIRDWQRVRTQLDTANQRIAELEIAQHPLYSRRKLEENNRIMQSVLEECQQAAANGLTDAVLAITAETLVKVREP